MLIGFIGAPCCGKSTTAFGLCHTLKTQGYSVEFFAEFARRQIIETRLQGLSGNGGPKGQNRIYTADSDNAFFYRNHADAISITDGSTVNCYFYGLDMLDLKQEAAKYDLLFYIPIADVPPTRGDANRVQNRSESMAMAQRWDNIIRPLLGHVPNIVELKGYPHQTAEQMLEQATRIVHDMLNAQEIKQAA